MQVTYDDKIITYNEADGYWLTEYDDTKYPQLQDAKRAIDARVVKREFMMRIGGLYRIKTGHLVGPMKLGNQEYPFVCAKTGHSFTPKGTVYISKPSKFDIVEEVVIVNAQDYADLKMYADNYHALCK